MMPGVRVLPSPASACCVASTATGVRPLHLPARLLSEYSAHLAQTPFELLMLPTIVSAPDELPLLAVGMLALLLRRTLGAHSPLQ